MSYGSLTLCKQYWVTYAFLTVIESAINAVYWFPFYYVFKFVLVLWMALPQTGYILSQRFPRPRSSKLTTSYSGAQIIFRSLLQPLFARFFENSSSSTSGNLRKQADAAAAKTQ